MVREVQERRRGGEFLALEEHRRAGAQEHQRGHRLVQARAGQELDPVAAGRVGDLVVILQAGDEGGGVDAEGRGAAVRLAEAVELALEQEAPLDRRDQLLRRAVVVGVIGLGTLGHRHRGGVVEVVVPDRVEPVTALLDRADQPDLLVLVLGDQDDRPLAGRVAGQAAHLGEEVLGRAVVDRMRGVQPQAVEVELVDPVARRCEAKYRAPASTACRRNSAPCPSRCRPSWRTRSRNTSCGRRRRARGGCRRRRGSPPGPGRGPG